MSKKVIEQEHKYGSIEVESFTPKNLTLTQITDFTYDEVVVSKSKATTVAKAICPEYQKVIDRVIDLAEQVDSLSIQVEELKKSSKEWCDKAMEKHNELRKIKHQNAKLVEALDGLVFAMTEDNKHYEIDLLKYFETPLKQAIEALQNTKNIEG